MKGKYFYNPKYITPHLLLDSNIAEWLKKWNKLINPYRSPNASDSNNYSKKSANLGMEPSLFYPYSSYFSVSSGKILISFGSNKIEIFLNVLSDEKWDEITTLLASKIIFESYLRNNFFASLRDKEFARIMKLLIPHSITELKLICTCQNDAVNDNICVHIVNHWDSIGEMFNTNIENLFLFRGKSIEELLKLIRIRRNQIQEKLNNQKLEELSFNSVKKDDIKSEPEKSDIFLRDPKEFWRIAPEINESLHFLYTKEIINNNENLHLDKKIAAIWNNKPYYVGNENFPQFLISIYENLSKQAIKFFEQKQIQKKFRVIKEVL